jgi:hypothetical protein
MICIDTRGGADSVRIGPVYVDTPNRRTIEGFQIYDVPHPLGLTALQCKKTAEDELGDRGQASDRAVGGVDGEQSHGGVWWSCLAEPSLAAASLSGSTVLQ